MFFSGDPAAKRKVELRGRSSKEADRQGLLHKLKDERERRQQARLRQNSAIVIQKWFRGRTDVAARRKLIREEFYQTFGERNEKVSRNAFKPESNYLPAALYFLYPTAPEDLPRLVNICRLFMDLIQDQQANVFGALANGSYAANRGAINCRARNFASTCLRYLHRCRNALKEEFMNGMSAENNMAAVLVETILVLTRVDLPWAASVLQHLVLNKLFHVLRDLVLTAKITEVASVDYTWSALERLVFELCMRVLKSPQPFDIPLSWSFPAQLFSVPLLWKRLPLLKQVSASEGLWAYSVHVAATSLLDIVPSLPSDVSVSYPSSLCFLGNIMEAATIGLAQPDCSVDMVTGFANLGSYLIGKFSSFLQFQGKQHGTDEDEADDDMEQHSVRAEPSLLSQLQYACHPDVQKRMLKAAFARASIDLNKEASVLADMGEGSAVGAICCFFYASFSLGQRTAVFASMAYSSQIIQPLWQHIKHCHLRNTWPSLETPAEQSSFPLPAGVLGRMLPLTVFSAVFGQMLHNMDNEEFYEKQNLVTIEDVVQAVLILKEALWQVLWELSKPPVTSSGLFSADTIREQFIFYAGHLIAELYDRNSRRQFVQPAMFNVSEAMDDFFVQQAQNESTRASDVLSSVPCLVPFASRVRVYTAQVVAAKEAHAQPLTRVLLKVQRNTILQDSFTQLRALDIRGTIRVSFLNDLGVEEAGVDGGGMFKDFMETITKAAFDVQYGLFKETQDHLLYPNPASHLVIDNHLDYFEFVGMILGKAMIEGILVDIPFATFFLSKLKKKFNGLHDLPSLDPELYKNLLFLKNNASMVSQLGLYFVINDNDYGEQREVELVPGGKDIQVTEANVFQYIHLVANHRLNTQIRHQSSYFLRGFQQLISPEWIQMFNEHELQILISGSRDGMDVEDLRMNVNYNGGYHENHPVIKMFWDTLKTFDSDLQQKFLKFVTGCSRGPLLGFKYLEPHFCIQKTAPEDAGDDTLDRLPTAATCMNLLKLPPYKSRRVIREKLLYAITSGSGFDLS